MARPCTCDRIDTCTRCRLYHTNEKYRRLWDGEGTATAPTPNRPTGGPKPCNCCKDRPTGGK